MSEFSRGYRAQFENNGGRRRFDCAASNSESYLQLVSLDLRATSACTESL